LGLPEVYHHDLALSGKTLTLVSVRMTSAQHEIQSGQRFPFGRNWAAFLETLHDDRIAAAENSLRTLLQVEDLQGKRFLDIGSGSGLFSLAARRLGARVVSFDFDPESVACTRSLRQRYFPGDQQWQIEQGSALDPDWIRSLGAFDVVYSWGVLHHTGDMWSALHNAQLPVTDQGRLVLAIYNDQGLLSRFWLKVKQIYCSGFAGRFLISLLFIPWFFVRTILVSVVRRKNQFRSYRNERGMSLWHDWHDWLGGLPFEVARPEELLSFYRQRGFELENLVTTNNLGCNQFVFRRLRSA
jgi:2-polyprenyl-6-hydroxyphenyl methylase/3-demethylubiquinone-9 3-methyltransferase